MTKLWEQVRRARKNFLQALAINFQCPAYDPSLLNDIDIEMKIFNINHKQIVFAFRTELLKDQKKERVRATLE